MKLLEKIEYLLNQHLDIKNLKIEDESHKHAGHKQNQNAGSHFKATIVSKSFDNYLVLHRSLLAAY